MTVASFLRNNQNLRAARSEERLRARALKRTFAENLTVAVTPRSYGKPILVNSDLVTDRGEASAADLSTVKHQRYRKDLSIPTYGLRSRPPCKEPAIKVKCVKATSSSGGKCEKRVVSRMLSAIDSPPKSKKEYHRLIDDFIKANTGKRMSFEPPEGGTNGGRVWAISDLNVEHQSNKLWLDKLQPRLKDVVIVAGNVAENIRLLRTALSILTKRFRAVFFCVGSLELRTSKGSSLNSLQKLLQVLVLCDELGVHVNPTLLGDELAIVPIHSFFNGDHFGIQARAIEDHGLGTPRKENQDAALDAAGKEQDPSRDPGKKTSSDAGTASFDSLCYWPPEVGDPSNPRNSHHPRIASFFLGLNKRAINCDYGARCKISFGHWVPDSMCCEALPQELHHVRIAPPQYLATIEKLKPRAHIFSGTGYTTKAMQVDCVIGSTRFVSNSLPPDATNKELASCKLAQVYPCEGDNIDPKLQTLYPVLGAEWRDAVKRDAARREHDPSSPASLPPSRQRAGSAAMNWEDSWVAGDTEAAALPRAYLMHHPSQPMDATNRPRRHTLAHTNRHQDATHQGGENFTAVMSGRSFGRRGKTVAHRRNAQVSKPPRAIPETSSDDSSVDNRGYENDGGSEGGSSIDSAEGAFGAWSTPTPSEDDDVVCDLAQYVQGFKSRASADCDAVKGGRRRMRSKSQPFVEPVGRRSSCSLPLKVVNLDTQMENESESENGNGNGNGCGGVGWGLLCDEEKGVGDKQGHPQQQEGGGAASAC